ncbi:hypothetical protein ABW17_30190 [Mycobacterium nebraskense]|uniref:GNAT family N-acetyltransferase n=1 Tax=Mycobacterium nebraskense TaxID=244292 RepID=UPI00064248EB|nr:GNAT family N-acetyltransferase [Mycobacterium nebraskense]KLO25280.1 hypothetical protein ABW17_30190 [Mycobacterium nebraskense]
MTVVFAHVAPEDAAEAFDWHRAFAEADEHIFPRSWDEFEQLANDWELVCARENGEIVGLCYYTLDGGTWEIGGLMVHRSQQGRGVGSTLMRITLGNLLFDLDPLSRGESIISHVHRDNNAPRKIIVEQ